MEHLHWLHLWGSLSERRMSTVGLQALGTGDGWASDHRGHSAFLFRMAGSTLLMDCGEPVGRSLRAAGVQPDDLDGIILSHLHCDHVGGFFMLMQGFWLDQRTRDLTVHMPEEGREPVRRMLDAAYIFDELTKITKKILAVCLLMGFAVSRRGPTIPSAFTNAICIFSPRVRSFPP